VFGHRHQSHWQDKDLPSADTIFFFSINYQIRRWQNRLIFAFKRINSSLITTINLYYNHFLNKFNHWDTITIFKLEWIYHMEINPIHFTTKREKNHPKLANVLDTCWWRLHLSFQPETFSVGSPLCPLVLHFEITNNKKMILHRFPNYVINIMLHLPSK
jgi:hypothetical protein